ncbi:hypothetical protein J6590_062591 [Homalodisca vitripennis]|nr:hypothetical protein J6590_062591 [Homalodisca vitripennis]
MAWSNGDNIEMILFNDETGRNVHEAVRLFNAAYPERPVDKAYIGRLVKKFSTTFIVEDAPRPERPAITTEEVRPYKVQPLIMDPSEESIIKGKPNQELTEDDPDPRLQFYEEMLQKIDENNN